MGLIWFIAGVVFTAIVGVVFVKYSYHRKIYTPYKEIKEHIYNKPLTFSKRISNMAYFALTNERVLVLDIKNKKISIYNEDECVYLFPESLANEERVLCDKIENDYYQDIYVNITIVDGIYVSNSYAEEKMYKYNNSDGSSTDEYMIEFVVSDDNENKDSNKSMDIDSIMDKINRLGKDSLSEEEKNFLDDLNNWD